MSSLNASVLCEDAVRCVHCDRMELEFRPDPFPVTSGWTHERNMCSTFVDGCRSACFSPYYASCKGARMVLLTLPLRRAHPGDTRRISLFRFLGGLGKKAAKKGERRGG